MRRYFFKLELSGIGESSEDAWNDAVEQFSQDPGLPEWYKFLEGTVFEEVK